jgi:hypothetical protein
VSSSLDVFEKADNLGSLGEVFSLIMGGVKGASTELEGGVIY